MLLIEMIRKNKKMEEKEMKINGKKVTVNVPDSWLEEVREKKDKV